VVFDDALVGCTVVGATVLMDLEGATEVDIGLDGGKVTGGVAVIGFAVLVEDRWTFEDVETSVVRMALVIPGRVA
jgi:putative flippase GtrA